MHSTSAPSPHKTKSFDPVVGGQGRIPHSARPKVQCLNLHSHHQLKHRCHSNLTNGISGQLLLPASPNTFLLIISWCRLCFESYQWYVTMQDDSTDTDSLLQLVSCQAGHTQWGGDTDTCEAMWSIWFQLCNIGLQDRVCTCLVSGWSLTGNWRWTKKTMSMSSCVHRPTQHRSGDCTVKNHKQAFFINKFRI